MADRLEHELQATRDEIIQSKRRIIRDYCCSFQGLALCVAVL